MNPFAAALPAFARAFGETVTYSGAGLPSPTAVAVIWSDVAGTDFLGPGNTTRQVSFEISRAALPERPGKADRITRNSIAWKPIEVIERDDIDSWIVVLELA